MTTSLRAIVLVVSSTFSACGGAEPREATAPPRASSSEPSGEPGGDGASSSSLEVSKELRRVQPQGVSCASGDVCGFFLPLASPGTDPERLARLAVDALGGKCGGHVIVYRDKRDVMGSGVVLASADAKRACEKALGRPEDRDFPSEQVFRVAP